METKKTPIWKCVLAVIVLWVSVLVGGTLLVYLINALNFMGGYSQDSLGYYLLGIAGGPVGVWIGKEAMDALTEIESHVFRAVNFVVVSVFCGCFLFFGIVTSVLSLYNILLSLATGIASAVVASAEFSDLKKYQEKKNGHNS